MKDQCFGKRAGEYCLSVRQSLTKAWEDAGLYNLERKGTQHIFALLWEDESWRLTIDLPLSAPSGCCMEGVATRRILAGSNSVRRLLPE